MYSASFIFEPGTYDERFHTLDALIEEAALATPGYLGAETWRSPDGERVNATYFWETEESLRAFSVHPSHLEAKSQYTRWYKGFHIVISQVLHSYGDGTILHITPNQRKRA
ncbi:antibiotic biosynthesis monooxygenase [Polaromonas sp.]|uniref:antibiotic biosynthesis monooxygenase family protein n=1 Tax=Polaromonas sp. TaxID=1869339 RepID=UPI003267C94D